MLEKVDPKVAQIIKKEEVRQERVINLIASENYTSKAVREALGSVFTNKYSEGYPLKRYYGGNEFVDEVETLAQERAKKLFGVNFANVQGFSGSPANLAIYFALAEVGDTIMGLSLPSGGHLTRGWGVNFSGKYYKSVQYTVNAETELIDFDNMLSLAKEHKPKLIWAGATAYSRVFDWKRFREVCDEVGAYLIADVSHIAGLIVAGVHPSPVGIADVIMTTTHKTLRGPRGALILTNDEELATKIDKAVFPGLQGGPHNNTTAAIAVCLQEASTAEFKAYGKQVVENAKTLASVLLNQGFRLVSGGTDNHMLLIDFGEGGLTGKEAESILETVGIIVNRNTVPGQTRKPFVTSGIRLGTPAVTTRGFSKQEMQTVAEMIASVLKNPSDSEIARKTLSLV